MSDARTNILYFSSFGHLRWGGQKSLFQLVTRLNRNKYTPHVIVPTDEELAEGLRQSGIEVIVHHLSSVSWHRPQSLASSVKFLLRLIEEKDIHILHTDGPRNTLYAALPARINRRALVWHVRSSEKDPLDPLLVSFCNRIVLVARTLRLRFPHRVKEEKFSTIYNGVDLREFDNASPSSIRSDYGINDDVLLIGSFARIDPMKGQLGLIEACGNIKDSFSFKLFLFGEIHDAAYHRVCIETAFKLGISDKVVFAGFHNDIAPFVKSMDVIVLNSSHEAFPRSVIEAMAAARPVIATDVGGTREAIEDGVTGFVVFPSDIKALSDRIRVLAFDPTLREHYGQAGRKKVEEFFSLEANVRKTEQLYEELTSAVHVQN